MTTALCLLLAGPLFAQAPAQPVFAPGAPAQAQMREAPTPAPDFEARRAELLDSLRDWYMDDSGTVPEPAISFSTSDELAYKPQLAELRSLAAEAAFMKKGRAAALDDFQAHSDMSVLVARHLGVKPPEAAIPVYRGRLRAEDDALSPAEEAVRARLLASQKAPGIAKRYLFIADLVGAPEPDYEPAKTRVVVVKTKKGRKVKKVIRPPELAPPPKPVSVISQIDWQKADELAEVADDNAHGWDRKPKETLRRYRRRLRRLRAHCYEWVRRDLTALGIWDAELFRGYVPPTRRDRKRPIRAASFALAMAKIEGSADIASKTNLRQLNLRVDPLVRGAIVVFSQSVCGYSPRNGHIEIITSVEPLQAASFKFHPVKTECLVEAAKQNKVHVYVPLRPSSGQAPGR